MLLSAGVPSCPKVGGWASRHLVTWRGRVKWKQIHIAAPTPPVLLFPGEFKEL